ncbi:MAG: soluble lytic murein transglycosylase [Polyangiales bacterium]|jgi:soluble lytic murein transglycosylase
MISSFGSMVLSRTAIAGIALVIATCEQPSVAPQHGAQAQSSEVTPTPEAPRRFHPGAARAPDVVEALRSSSRPELLLERISDPAERGIALWVVAQREGLEVERREAMLLELAGMGHPLTPWAAYRLAELSYEEDAERALSLLETIPADFPSPNSVLRIRALTLVAAGRVSDAIPLLRQLVAEAPQRSGAASAAMPLAAILLTQDDVASKEEALQLLRRVATRAPKARVGQEAAAQAEVLLAALPEIRRRALANVPLADRFREADALYASNHHRDAEAAYAALVASMGPDEPRRCEALLQQGKAILRQRARQRGAPFMHDVARRCTGDERAWAHYKAGRAYAQSGDAARARTEYAALLQHSPQHRLADDVIFRTALLEQGRDRTEYERLLQVLIDDHQDGDMRGEAIFRLAMHHREGDRHEEALVLFEAGRDVGENTEGLQGRSAYWRARTLAALNRPAVDAYAEVVQAWPLSYYSQHALARILAESPERHAELLSSLQSDDEPELSFPWRAELDDPRFVRALVLLQVGASDEALEELSAIGFFGSGADDDAKWLVASLLAEAGELTRLTRLVRGQRGFRRTMPTGRARALWRLAYPQAFAPLIENAASAAEVSSALVRAVAREESSFDPNAVSWAHAYGLVQVLLPTARRYGRDLDERITARNVRDPEINLHCGTKFMAWLQGRYPSDMFIPAAYNAGHGSLDRWLRRARASQTPGDQDFDAFVESIPFDETRRYTRRVLQTYGVYSWLDTGRLPEMPTTI